LRIEYHSSEWGTLKLLVVDDNAILREQMAKYLRREDHEVTAVPNAEQALRTMDEETFEVCITDHKMTGMNGMDLVAAIEDRYPATKVLLMTGSIAIQMAVKALNKGAYEVFHKPFQMDQILATLARIQQDQSTQGGRKLAA